MSRMSQELARTIAEKLTEKTRASVKNLENSFSKLVKDAYVSQTPKEVLEVYRKYPNWASTRRVVQFRGHGFRWESVSVDEPLVCNQGSSYNCHLELDEKLAAKLTTAKRKWEKAKEEFEKLKSETTEALLALRTFNNIREHIPSASEFLPPPISNSLVVNFSSLNKKLEKQPKSLLETLVD